MDWARELSDRDWAEALAGGDDRVPPMPPAEVQAMFVGSSGAEAFQEAAAFWNHTQRVMRETGQPLSQDTQVLDIGVGWGRLYRWVLRDLPAANVVGIDVDPGAIEMCARMMPYGNFRHVPPGQRYPLGERYYDIAFLYSVFSHLSEGTARAVLADARKALKPGGLLALTTFRLLHIDVWERQQSQPYYGEQLAASNFNRSDWWERASEGQYLYLPTGGGDPSRPADAYGEAVVPKGWWENVEGYRLVTFERPKDLPQAYVVLQAI